MEKRLTGKTGEILVCRHYLKNGYAILDTNYRCRFGEIDIVAKKEETIVFIEVKTREKQTDYTAKDAVTPAKQQRLKSTALMYISSNKFDDEFVRFDVAEVYIPSSNPTINIIENAFE